MSHNWLTDSTLCPPHTAKSWAGFTGLMGPWIVEPLIVLPLMIVLFGAIGFIPRRFGRRWLRLMLCVSALVYLMVLFPPTIAFAEKVLAKQKPARHRHNCRCRRDFGARQCVHPFAG